MRNASVSRSTLPILTLAAYCSCLAPDRATSASSELIWCDSLGRLRVRLGPKVSPKDDVDSRFMRATLRAPLRSAEVVPADEAAAADASAARVVSMPTSRLDDDDVTLRPRPDPVRDAASEISPIGTLDCRRMTWYGSCTCAVTSSRNLSSCACPITRVLPNHFRLGLVRPTDLSMSRPPTWCRSA